MTTDNKNLLLIFASLIGLGALAGWRRGFVSAEFSQVKASGELSDTLANIAAEYGLGYARDIERLVRLETANFTSGQWELYNTAGMEATQGEFPFGWGSLAEYAAATGIDPNDFFIGTMSENQTGIIKSFIGFPSQADFLYFLAWFIDNKRGGNFGKWFSLDPGAAAGYYATMQTIAPTLI
jgi:hypothetical protein